jgi:hypothetical protein
MEPKDSDCSGRMREAGKNVSKLSYICTSWVCGDKNSLH